MIMISGPSEIQEVLSNSIWRAYHFEVGTTHKMVSDSSHVGTLRYGACDQYEHAEYVAQYFRQASSMSTTVRPRSSQQSILATHFNSSQANDRLAVETLAWRLAVSLTQLTSLSRFHHSILAGFHWIAAVPAKRSLPSVRFVWFHIGASHSHVNIREGNRTLVMLQRISNKFRNSQQFQRGKDER